MTLTNCYLERLNDGRIRIHKMQGWKDCLRTEVIAFSGPDEPEIPNRPLSRQEFYILLGDLAAKGYWDSLLR
jgi:hypothetical protein